MATEMATRSKKPAKAQRAPSPSRRSRTARSRAIKRLPDAITDTFDGERPFSGWRGITRAEVAAESAQAVVLTRDAVANAVRAMVRLAARWEADDGFSSASPELCAHKRKALEDVVSILQVEEQSAPIANIDKYRITRDDAKLLTVFQAVEDALAEYAKSTGDDAVPAHLTWLLGNTYRVPADKLERAWVTEVRKAAANAAGTSGAGKRVARNWIRQADGPTEAAKKLLAGIGVPGASAGRIGALKRIAAAVNRQHPHRSIDGIFDALEAKAHGSSLTENQLRSFVERVIR